MRRHRMSKRSSRRHFSKHGRGTHVRNLRAHPMRGGFRI